MLELVTGKNYDKSEGGRSLEKKGNKVISTIISKTLVFLFVVLFVSIFKYVFGNENSLIGVTTIVLTLVLLEQNLTGKFIENSVLLIIFNLILGLGAFVGRENLWLGIPINFVIMLSIGYLFSYELKKPINMLVGLHYILMITSPITANQLPMRLLALVVGACIIMLSQLLINKDKLAKCGDKLLSHIEDEILEKLFLLKQNEDVTKINLNIDNEINKLKLLIFHSTKKDFSITNHGKSIIKVLSCLENINILLESTDLNKNNLELLNDFYIQLTKIKDGHFHKSSLQIIIRKYQDTNENVYEFIHALENLYTQKENALTLLKEEKNNIDYQCSILEDFKTINIHKKQFNLKSNRVAYGIRLGLLVAITTFITNYFNLNYGNWLVYTVFALTQPYSEFTKVKSKKRLAGTIIGALIIFVLFNIVQDPSNRTLILLVTGYLMGYVSDYRNIVTFVTITSISSASINVPDPNYIIMNRLMFVIIGIMVALIANKFLFHRKYEDEETRLINVQTGLSKRISTEVFHAKESNEHTIEILYLIQGLIEARVENLNLQVEKEMLYKNKVLLNKLYQIHLHGDNIYENVINKAKTMVKDMNLVTNGV